MTAPAQPTERTIAGFMSCPACGGTGDLSPDDWEFECPECLGQGWVCDRCGAAPEHVVDHASGEKRGGCWCHY